MRSKDDILYMLSDFLADKPDPIALREYADTLHLEVLLDIRDLLDTRLSTLFNLLLDWKDRQQAARQP